MFYHKYTGGKDTLNKQGQSGLLVDQQYTVIWKAFDIWLCNK